MKRIKDITNQKFGSLTAIKPSHKNERHMWYWVFKCDCGKEHIARANVVAHQHNLKKDPQLPSCGCVELARKTKHGFRKAVNTHPAYKAYRGIMSRCYNPKDRNYKWYGAVGVTMCDEWKDNPEMFVKWSIDNGWKPNLHIDKDILCELKGIKPHIYSPDTCQWVSAKTNGAFATNRDNFGKHPNIRLSHKEVDEILRLFISGEITNKSELARMFNLKSPSSVSRLIKLAENKVQSNA